MNRCESGLSVKDNLSAIKEGVVLVALEYFYDLDYKQGDDHV